MFKQQAAQAPQTLTGVEICDTLSLLTEMNRPADRAYERRGRGMKKKKLWIGAAALAAAVVVFLAAYVALSPGTEAGEKTVTVEIVHGDGSQRTVELRTEAAYLGGALAEEEGLIEGDEGPYGLYITSVDGESASDADRTWWCITKGGAEVTTGVDLTPIADGDQFELTLMTY